MPSIIFFIVVVLAGWYGYRAFKREASRVSQEVRQAEKEAQNRAHGTLVQDPKTGEYRVKRD
jgi:membrane protein implicated in regulation of membrane protease activity